MNVENSKEEWIAAADALLRLRLLLKVKIWRRKQSANVLVVV
jgi:hypothetical protein